MLVLDALIRPAFVLILHDTADQLVILLQELRLGGQRPGPGAPSELRLRRGRQVARRRGGRPLIAGGRRRGKVSS